jgi:hypothetical protein
MQRSRHFKQSQMSIAGNVATSPLRTALWVWFACGLMALLAFPSVRGSSPMIGWLPFWLVIAPLIDLALLRPHWLATTSRAFLVSARRRRRPARQARRLQRRRVLRTSSRPQFVNP